jgi:hypothetical protein
MREETVISYLQMKREIACAVSLLCAVSVVIYRNCIALCSVSFVISVSLQWSSLC